MGSAVPPTSDVGTWWEEMCLEELHSSTASSGCAAQGHGGTGPGLLSVLRASLADEHTEQGSAGQDSAGINLHLSLDLLVQDWKREECCLEKGNRCCIECSAQRRDHF